MDTRAPRPRTPWVQARPEYYLPESDLARAPQNYTRVGWPPGDQVHAYGRDPHFTGWPDTFQLNHGSPALQEAMIGELVKRAVGGEASVAVPIGHTMGQLVGLLLVPGLMGMAVCLLAGRGTGVRGSSRDRGPRGAWRLVVGSRRNARVR